MVLGLAQVRLHRDPELRLGEVLLLFGAGLSLAKLALLDGCLLLASVRLDLFLGHLARSELRQDLFDVRVARRRLRRADEHLLQFQIVPRELGVHLD